jgi:hypothetical protein
VALLEKNKYLFEIGDEVDFREAVKEFMIEDERRGFIFLNKVYDMEDYKKYI